MTVARAWVQAARPLAHANIAPPLLLGQALAYAAHGTFSWTSFGLAHAFAFFDHLFIVFANDVADRETDASNETFTQYSGGSRVVPEGKLSPDALRNAAWVALAGMLGVSGYGAVVEDRAWMIAAGGVAALLLWAYSFSPLRLSYRGHGEWLQGLGVGVVLPSLGFYVQSGTLTGLPWSSLAAGCLLGATGNVLTALPDVPSDAAAGKRSLPVRMGPRRARVLVLTGAALAGVGLTMSVAGASIPTRAFVCGATIAPLVAAARTWRSADASERRECALFVTAVGGAIGAAWVGTALLAFMARAA